MKKQYSSENGLTQLAEEQGYDLKQGVYFASTGPTYETPAEYKYYKRIGADAVGMSVITNEAHDDYADDYVNDGDDVVKAADAAADTMTALFTRIIERL